MMHESNEDKRPVEEQLREEALGIASRCWCAKSTEHIVLEPALAKEVARAVLKAQAEAIMWATGGVTDDMVAPGVEREPLNDVYQRAIKRHMNAAESI